MSWLELQPVGGYECDGEERRRYFQFLNWLGSDVRFAKLYSDEGLHAETIKAGLLPTSAIPGREINEDLEELGDIPSDEKCYGGLEIQDEGKAIAKMERILEEREARIGAEMFNHSMAQD